MTESKHEIHSCECGAKWLQVGMTISNTTHPEAQGNKDLGEPALRALVEELANALREVRRLFAQYGHVLFDSEADDIEQTIDAALVSYQARSAAPTSPQPIKGESELESASNGMGLR